MTELGSVNLLVADIAAAERFYVDILGLQVDDSRSHRPSFLLLRAANCMIILQEAPAPPDAGAAIELGFAVDDVDAIAQKLGDRATIQQMGWGRAIETTGPAGARMNFYRLLQHPPTEEGSPTRTT